ncbi:hypothetical protein ACXR2T_07800 [Leucobacter sp. HY1910]
MSIYVDPTTSADNQRYGALIERLCQEKPDSESRREEISRVITLLEQDEKITTWTRGLRYRHKAFLQAEDDLHQVVALAIIELLQRLSEQDVVRIRARYMEHFYQHAKSRISKYLTSGEVTGLAEASGAARRQFLVTAAIRSLTDQGVTDPTPEEIIAENERLTAGYANPVKNGVVLTMRDLVPFGIVTSGHDSGVAENFDRPNVQMDTYDGLEHDDRRFELDQAVRALVQHLRALHPGDQELLSCAAAWMKLVYVGVKPTAAQITEHGPLDAASVKRCLPLFEQSMSQFRSAARVL